MAGVSLRVPRAPRGSIRDLEVYGEGLLQVGGFSFRALAQYCCLAVDVSVCVCFFAKKAAAAGKKGRQMFVGGFCLFLAPIVPCHGAPS